MAVPDKALLLVEDNPDDAALAQAALESAGAGYRLEIAEDGEQALEKLSGTPLVDLVLLDIKLPGINGFEVLRRIRSDERTRHLPVVVLTSSIEESDVLRTYQLGANSYVRKPTDFDDFVPLLRELTHYWLRVNQPAEAR